jgi:hypothetical protein
MKNYRYVLNAKGIMELKQVYELTGQCECIDCLDADDPLSTCYSDCGECFGCKEAKEVALDAQFDIDDAQGKNY